MKYKLNRSGHAPGFLRVAFQEWASGQANDTVINDGIKRPLLWLLGQLWNCADILPGFDCTVLNIPSG